MPVLLGAVALLGLAIGSFLNVVVSRVPAGESLVSPASRCPSCQHSIRARHNLPVLGWLLLRGRCADCARPISARYPLLELTTGALFLCVTIRLAQLDELTALPAFLYFTAIGLALSLIDIAHHKLPNPIVLPSYPVLLVLLVLPALLHRDWSQLTRVLTGGAALYGWFYLTMLIRPAGMGFGDVKLAGLIGGTLAYLSWSTLIVGSFAAFALGGMAGLLVILSRRGTRRTAVPFGPFLIAGALLAIFAAAPLSAGYLNLLGL